jgi:hypothetical protein
MLTRILLALALAPTAALAQYMTVGPNGQLVPAGSTVIVAGQGGGPILATPSLGFGTPQTTAGISLADRAGISNAAPAPTAAPAEVYPGYNGEQIPAEGMPAGAAGVSETGRLINDAGPSYYAGAAYVGGGVGPAGLPVTAQTRASLGELAAKYKSSRPQNIRTYSNADAERLSGMPVHGANVTPVAAQSTGTATQQTQVAMAQPAPAVQPVANGRPSPAVRAESGQSTTTDEGATTPQVSQQSKRNQGDQDRATRLPASSTLLPLFGLLGVASGALGLWLKFRN